MEISNSSGKNSYSNKQEPWFALDSGAISWQKFSPQDQEKIVKHFAPKIRYIALRLKARLPKHIELNELISSGTLGLLEALNKFKPEFNIKFDTYAEARIRGAMLDELRTLDWFPRSLRQRVKQLEEFISKFSSEKGRHPTEEEILATTNLELKDLRETMEAIHSQACLSLDALQETGVVADGIEISADEPFLQTEKAELINKISILIDNLTPRAKLVLSLYYVDELNMREAAEVIGITEGRVSQLHTQALIRLRKEFKNKFHDANNY